MDFIFAAMLRNTGTFFKSRDDLGLRTFYCD